MKKTFNFDTGMSLHNWAKAKGYGSKEWIEFATMMFDEFPSLYETARQMTVHQDDLWREILSFREKQEELLELARLTLAYIDAIPKDAALPAMPGFDRDWADNVIAKANGE